MAEQSNKGSRLKALSRTNQQRLYFYVDGKLYKTLSKNRAANLLRAWSYSDEAIVDFVQSDVKRNSQQAFDTREVCVMLNRSYTIIINHMSKGAINKPVKIGVQPEGFGHYKWSEDDVLALHEYFLNVVGGSGPARKDGRPIPARNLPTRMEVIAMMKQQRMYYVQDDDGNFVPVFEQPDWA